MLGTLSPGDILLPNFTTAVGALDVENSRGNTAPVRTLRSLVGMFSDGVHKPLALS